MGTKTVENLEGVVCYEPSVSGTADLQEFRLPRKPNPHKVPSLSQPLLALHHDSRARKADEKVRDEFEHEVDAREKRHCHSAGLQDAA